MLRRFFGFERRWLRLIFQTILPHGAAEELPIGVKDIPIDRFIDELLRYSPGRFVLGFRAGLWVITLAPLLILGRFRTFAGLDEQDRIKLLDTMSVSNNYVVREMPMLFKMVACLGYCGHPSVQEQVGISVRGPSPEWLGAAESSQ